MRGILFSIPGAISREFVSGYLVTNESTFQRKRFLSKHLDVIGESMQESASRQKNNPKCERNTDAPRSRFGLKISCKSDEVGN